MKLHDYRCVIAAAILAVFLVLPAAAQVKDHRDIKYPPLAELKVEKPEVFTLKNGMTFFLLEDHELPLISVRARIRTGSYYEPADKVGLADLMATVQRTGGTTTMPGDEIDDYLGARAASVETGMGGDAGFASMDCLKDDFNDVFQVFSDVLRKPVFDEDKLKVAKLQTRAAIARRNDSIGAIIFREFGRLIYGPDSPLARLEEYATIAAVTRDDMVAFHKQYYSPNNVYLGVVGDFGSEEMKKKITAVFGEWAKGPDFDESELEYRKNPNPGVYFIEKTDVTQANIAIGHLGIERKDHPDYFSVQVMNEILGGSFASRLFSNVRSEKGLAYKVSGGVGSAFHRPGTFRVQLQTKSSTMAEGVEALKEEIEGMIKNPPSERELERAKVSILNSFVFNYDSKSKILAQQMTYAYNGFPSDFLEKYRTSIEGVSRDDVIEVAKKYIHPDQLTILVVGKPEDFDRPVKTFGKVSSIDISIPPPPDTTPEVARTAAGLEAGARILSKMGRAIGGENPEDLKAIRTSETVALTLGGQAMSMGRSVLTVFPDKIRQDIQTPMGEQVIVFKGDVAFMSAGGQVRDLSAQRVEEARKNLGRELTHLVRFHADPELEGIAAGRDEVDGAACEIVAVTYRGAESRLCVAADGRVLKQSYQGQHPIRRTPGRVELLFSDYRDVEGRQVPHKQVMWFEGQEVMSTTLESFEVNPQVDESAFEKPGA